MAVNATSMRRQCNSKLDTMLPASGPGKRGWKGIRPPVQQKLQWLNDYANGRPCLKQTICHSANGVESSSLAELSCVFLGELVVGHRVLLPITGADEGGRGVPEMQNRKHFTPKCGRGRSFPWDLSGSKGSVHFRSKTCSFNHGNPQISSFLRYLYSKNYILNHTLRLQACRIIINIFFTCSISPKLK